MQIDLLNCEKESELLSFVRSFKLDADPILESLADTITEEFMEDRPAFTQLIWRDSDRLKFPAKRNFGLEASLLCGALVSKGQLPSIGLIKRGLAALASQGGAPMGDIAASFIHLMLFSALRHRSSVASAPDHSSEQVTSWTGVRLPGGARNAEKHSAASSAADDDHHWEPVSGPKKRGKARRKRSARLADVLVEPAQPALVRSSAQAPISLCIPVRALLSDSEGSSEDAVVLPTTPERPLQETGRLSPRAVTPVAPGGAAALPAGNGREVSAGGAGNALPAVACAELRTGDAVGPGPAAAGPRSSSRFISADLSSVTLPPSGGGSTGVVPPARLPNCRWTSERVYTVKTPNFWLATIYGTSALRAMAMCGGWGYW